MVLNPLPLEKVAILSFPPGLQSISDFVLYSLPFPVINFLWDLGWITDKGFIGSKKNVQVKANFKIQTKQQKQRLTAVSAGQSKSYSVYNKCEDIFFPEPFYFVTIFCQSHSKTNKNGNKHLSLNILKALIFIYSLN